MAAARAAARAEATSLDEEVVETVAETVTEAPVGTTRRLRATERLNALPTLRCKGSGWSCGLVRRASSEEQAPEEQAQRRMPTMWYSYMQKISRHLFIHVGNARYFVLLPLIMKCTARSAIESVTFC
jgi:hypothetical protein